MLLKWLLKGGKPGPFVVCSVGVFCHDSNTDNLSITILSPSANTDSIRIFRRILACLVGKGMIEKTMLDLVSAKHAWKKSLIEVEIVDMTMRNKVYFWADLTYDLRSNLFQGKKHQHIRIP